MRRSPGRAAVRGPGQALTRAVGRVRRHGEAIVLAALAAGVSYLVAGWAFGPENAFFAPIAAVVTVSITAGQRTRRAVEIAAGVVVGLLAADLLLRVTGAGPWQLGLAVLVAMTLAVALRAGALISNQAAVAAVLVMSLSPTLGTHPATRLGDALIGGAVGLSLNALVPRDVRREVIAAGRHLTSGLAEVLHGLADALRAGRLTEAEAAGEGLDRVSTGVAEMDTALEVARERLRLVRRREPRGRALLPAELVRARADLLLATARSAARAVANATRHAAPATWPPPEAEAVAEALATLADAVDRLGPWMSAEVDDAEVREVALRAALLASAPGARSATTVATAAQVRSGAVDVLRATGMDHREAVTAVEEVAGAFDRGPGPQGPRV